MTTDSNNLLVDTSLLDGSTVVVRTHGSFLSVRGKLHGVSNGISFKPTHPPGAELTFERESVGSVEHKKHLLVVKMTNRDAYDLSFYTSLRPWRLKAAFASALGQPLRQQSTAEKLAMWIPAIAVGVVGLIAVAVLVSVLPVPEHESGSRSPEPVATTASPDPPTTGRRSARTGFSDVDITVIVNQVRRADGRAGPEVAQDARLVLQRFPDADVPEMMAIAGFTQTQLRDVCGGPVSMADTWSIVAGVVEAGLSREAETYREAFSFAVVAAEALGCGR